MADGRNAPSSREYRGDRLSLGYRGSRAEENRWEMEGRIRCIVTAGPTIRSGARKKLSFVTFKGFQSLSQWLSSCRMIDRSGPFNEIHKCI